MGRPKKKVEVVYQVKMSVYPIAPDPFEGEDYEIVLEAPKDYPAAAESIRTTKNVPGGFLWTPKIYDGEHSFLSETTDKQSLCKALLSEIEKGESGVFTKDYFVECDRLTPDVRQFLFFQDQFMRVWKRPEPPSNEILVQQFAVQMRAYLKAILFRMFSYYTMGYKVTFKKCEPKIKPVVQPTENKEENTAVVGG